MVLASNHRIPSTAYQLSVLRIRYYVPGIPWQGEQSDEMLLSCTKRWDVAP